MYEVNNISYQYSEDSKKIIDDISFKIKEKTVTAIVGPSGSGKSTLVSILSGVIPKLISTGKLSGKLNIDEDVDISVVSQNPESQLFGYGVEDAIAFGIENMGLDSKEISARIEYVLDLLNIQHLRKKSVADLSGGQRQAVCIASVLAMKPGIVIMDEPVSSLDPNGKKMVQSVLNQLRSTGQTTIIVDNNLDWFSDIVDHVIGIIDGKVVFDGTRDEFFMNFELQEKLGVNVPQEVEIYSKLSKEFKDIKLFYKLEDAKNEISKLIQPNNKKGILKEVKDNEGSVVIKVKNLTKEFSGNFKALDNVNASFEKGRIISILGQNGSGKTTLVKHLNGLHRPTSGEVLYGGQSTKNKSVAEISKDIILVFQHPEHMLFEETVTDELTFCARAQKVEFSKDDAENILKEYDLFDKKDEMPLNLSMGEKHTLTILSVLLSSAQVVMLDEPTLGMDYLLRKKLINIIEKLKEAGKTVIIISHEIPLVFEITDDILILNNSKKLFEGTKEEAVYEEQLFDDINIEIPPVVQLSKYFDLPEIAYDADSFVNQIKKLNELVC